MQRNVLVCVYVNDATDESPSGEMEFRHPEEHTSTRARVITHT